MAKDQVAPSYLSTKRKRLYTDTVSKWAFDPPALEMLESACRLLDVADQAREVVAKEGIVVHGARGSKEHPSLATERASRKEAASIFSRLGIHLAE